MLRYVNGIDPNLQLIQFFKTIKKNSKIDDPSSFSQTFSLFVFTKFGIVKQRADRIMTRVAVARMSRFIIMIMLNPTNPPGSLECAFP